MLIRHFAAFNVIEMWCKMSQSQDNFKRGTAEILILYLLSKEDLYGYQIVQVMEEKSEGAYTMLEGSLYPILYRLVNAGYISEYTKLVGKRRARKYYRLEESGKIYYEKILADYTSVVSSIDKILDR